MNGKIVVLLTDFGGRDGYPGIMKGVILSHDPGIPIVDLTHEIDAFDPLSGAYVLFTAWDHFPPGSVFCAVVDPGVGSRRRVLLAEIDERYLIAPDNGLVSLLFRMYPHPAAYALKTETIRRLNHEARRRPDKAVDYHRSESNTFHGRDLFAPAAAVCALGSAELIRGRRIQPVVLPAVFPKRRKNDLRGRILHIDRFGNCISSLHSTDLAALGGQPGRAKRIVADGFEACRIDKTYSDVSAGAPLCLFGSSGFLEIAVREGNAAQTFSLFRGAIITVTAANH